MDRPLERGRPEVFPSEFPDQRASAEKLPVHRARVPKLHANETKFIELHKQTQHKLEVMRHEYGAYLGTIAQAGKRGKIDASRVFIVEVCCGAGSHLSLDNPRNQVPGTAVQACIEARRVQRDFPGTHVSIRLVDSDREACKKLDARVAEFQSEGLVYPDLVDVQVIPKDLVSQIMPLLDETKKERGGRFCSLWFIDPFGPTIIPREVLVPLVRAGKGVEVIINLDVRGIKRLRDSSYSENTAQKSRETLGAELTALYGDDRWDVGPNSNEHEDAQLEALARMYADSFGDLFTYKAVYPLAVSDGQVRFLIHLTHSPRAQKVFAAAYSSTTRPATGSKALSMTDRDKCVQILFAKFAGNSVPFEEMVGLSECQLDRGQLRTVLRRALDTKHGVFDEKTKEMHWNTECLNPPALPLDPTQHTEKRRKKKVDQRLMQPGLFDGFLLPK